MMDKIPYPIFDITDDEATLLSHARILICDHDCSFLCYAVTAASYQLGGDNYNQSVQLRAKIMHSLDDLYSLRAWLELHHSPNVSLIREHRLRWIDALLDHHNQQDKS
jgi:hypothetical protein